MGVLWAVAAAERLDKANYFATLLKAVVQEGQIQEV